MGRRKNRRAECVVALVMLAMGSIGAIQPVAGAAPPRCFGRDATKVGTNGDDRIRGTQRADVIVSKGGHDTVRSLGGNDRICLGPGIDTAFAGDGNDKIAGERGPIDFMEGGGGDDLINGGSGAFDITMYTHTSRRIVANLEKQKVTGEGRDTLVGVESVESGSGNDLLIGTNRDNDLVGRGGNDVIRASGGDDFTVGGKGDDATNAGPGFDIVGYHFDPTNRGVEASMLTGTSTGQGNDTFSGGEFLVGTFLDDVLEGSDDADLIVAFDGDDTISGLGGDDELGPGGGDDIVDGGDDLDFYCPDCDDSPPDGVTVDLVAGTATGDGTDMLSNISGSGGTEGDDTLIGDDATSVLVSFGGDDTIDTGDGDDLADGGDGIDTIDGGGGLDYLGHIDHSTPVTVDLADGTTEGDGSIPDSDTFTGFEDVLGGFFNDVIRGDDGPNALRGEFGDDMLEGRGGDDILIGACAFVDGHFFLEPPCDDDGDDTLDGGTGTDQCLEGENNTSCETTSPITASVLRHYTQSRVVTLRTSAESPARQVFRLYR